MLRFSHFDTDDELKTGFHIQSQGLVITQIAFNFSIRMEREDFKFL